MALLYKIGIVLSLIFLVGLSPKKSVEVKVLSYSINHGRNYWAESNLREVVKLIQKEKPHMVAFQEVDSLFDSQKVTFHLRQLAVQMGFYYVYGASGDVEDGTYGVGILSKWPLENTQKLVLPHTPGMDARVMLCGLVSPVKGRYFRLCSARLEYASLFDRSLQSAFIHEVLSKSVQPVLLALDMGSRPYEQPYGFFKTQWIDAAKGSYLPTLAQGRPGERMDYLFALKNTTVRVKSYKIIRDYDAVSDHLPIVVNYELW